MRKIPSKAANSEAALSLAEMTKKLEEMNKRIERLEEHTGAAAYPLSPPPAKRGKGRRPKLEQEVLLSRRDMLVTWVERHWPYLSVALRKARSPHEAVAAFTEAEKRMSGICYAPFYRDPEKHEAALWLFLKSGRFHENPRNLAGAMAGLPELSWKRSLDVCSSHPCKYPLAIQAYWDHLRRRFPDRWRELREATTPEQARIVLKKSRTHDPTYLCLKENPEKALEWFNVGKPPEATPNPRRAAARK